MSAEPIRVTLYDINNKYATSTYVFIGSEDRPVLNAARSLHYEKRKIKASAAHAKTLYRKFGPSWKTIFADSYATQLPDKPTAGGVSDILNEILGGDFDEVDEFDDIDNIKIDEIELKEAKVVPKDETIPKTTIAEKVNISSVAIFPSDNMYTVKQKIFVETNIPVYEQHLFWFINGEYHTTYDYYSEDLIDTDIRSLQMFDKSDFLEKWISLKHGKSNIRVIPRDHFILCSQIPGIQLYVARMKDAIDILRNYYDLNYKLDYMIGHVYDRLVSPLFPMVSQPLLKTFIVKPDEVKRKFPLLSNSRAVLSKKFANEEAIMKGIYNTKSNIPVQTSIGLSVIEVLGKSTVNLRNIFDILHTSDTIPEIRAYINHDNKNYKLTKSYRYSKYDLSHKFPSKMRDGVVIAIKSDISLQANWIFLNFLSNGSYLVRCNFNENEMMTFKKIIAQIAKAIKPVLNIMNKNKYKVFNKPIEYEYPTSSNVIYKNVDMSLLWKKTLTENEYKLLRQQWSNILPTGIIKETRYRQSGVFEFIFSKGLRYYDESSIATTIKTPPDTDNYYSYLYNPEMLEVWNRNFTGKEVKMIHRTTDIKFEITNIIEDEFDIFDDIVQFVIGGFCKLSKSNTAPAVSSKLKKLKKLRESDPVLYNLKKYGTDSNYSILCQNPTQPLILSPEEVARMSKREKDKLTKYWNFTLNRSAYYKCPNPKYPHLNFIVGVHPLNYCLPCCKKIKSKEESPKTLQYNKCIKDHVWINNKKITKDEIKRYISVYGKETLPGRLSNISNSLDKLLSNTLSSKKQAYYIAGINKESNDEIIEITTLVKSIAMGFNIEINDILRKCIESITSNTFSTMINGRLSSKFESHIKAHEFLKNLFTLVTEPNTKNNIFLILSFQDIHDLICEVYADYAFILTFIDKELDGSNIILYVPSTVKNNILSDYVEDKPFLLLNRRKRLYNPIFIIDPEKFFKRSEIDSLTIPVDHKAYNIIEDVILMYSENEKKSSVNKPINMDLIQQFTKKEGDKIIVKYISSYNLCYGVMIQSKSGKYYLPVNFSTHSSDSVKVSLSTPNISGTKFSVLLQKINKLNKFIKSLSPSKSQIDPKYKLIEVDNFVTIKGKPTGEFLHDNIIFKFDIANGEYNSYFKKSSKVDIMHNMDSVNNAIRELREPDNDYSDRLANALYHNLKYQLFFNEFMAYLRKEKNCSIRRKICGILTSRGSTYTVNEKIKKLLQKHPNDLELILTFVNTYYRSDKAKLINIIKNNPFAFDNITLCGLRKLDRSVMVKKIKSLTSNFIVKGKVDMDNFPNVYLPCQTEMSDYCRGKKLIIEQDDKSGTIDQMVDILVSDIINPIKFNMMIQNISKENIINYFEFTKNKNEIISIDES